MVRFFQIAFYSCVAVLGCAVTIHAQVISINFASEEPAPDNEDNSSFIEAGEPAGILGSTEWNNVTKDWGPQDDSGQLTSVELVGGDGQPTSAEVIWESNNTWASGFGAAGGRSEQNIVEGIEENGDFNLILGYLDTSDFGEFCPEDQFKFLGEWCGAARVTVSNLPYENFDVVVYVGGGVLDRSGRYEISDEAGPRDAVYFQDTAPFDGNWDLSFEERDIDGGLETVYTGDVMIFEGLSGTEFTLQSHAALAGGTSLGFRAPINGIEIRPTDDPPPPTLLPGDANEDGIVNAADLNIVGSNWQQSVDPGRANGDFDNSGFVDAADLNVIGTNWQRTAEPLAASTATVPEPGSSLLLLLGGLALLVRRRR